MAGIKEIIYMEYVYTYNELEKDIKALKQTHPDIPIYNRKQPRRQKSVCL